jgi:hypothetical protein
MSPWWKDIHVSRRRCPAVDTGRKRDHVIFITMNSGSTYLADEENAYQAILGRVANEYTGSSLGDEFSQFQGTIYCFSCC